MMNSSLAVVPLLRGSSQPDISWIKKNVSVLAVARMLGLPIRHRRAKCWRPENHAHGDADPSLCFYERKNRVRCFVCDPIGGHSCVDLVMGFLGINVGEAVRWIAERFRVPNIKPGRPVGHRAGGPAPYRVGVHGSEWEVVVRSGMWGAMSAAERSILVVLDYFKDRESGLTCISYRAIKRYSGVKKMANISLALKELKKMHALLGAPSQRIGVTRECSAYRVTIDDPKFLELCDFIYTSARQEIAQEREYRSSQKRERQKAARGVTVKTSSLTVASSQILTQNTNTAGGLCPPDHPDVLVSSSNSKSPGERQATPTCEGQNLSSPGEVYANKALPARKREIGVLSPAELNRQKKFILEKYARKGEEVVL
jgi:hypothetical protein